MELPLTLGLPGCSLSAPQGRFAKRGDNKPEASAASTDGGSFCQTEASVGVAAGFQ